MRSETFHIRNIDCATCAAKIEHGLQGIPGVEEAVLDFAAQTLHIKATDLNPVLQKIQATHPEMELVRKQAARDIASPVVTGWDIVNLIASGILFLLLLFFEERIHQTAFAAYEVFAIAVIYLFVGENVIRKAVQTILRLDFLDENVLMVIATLGALFIHAYTEAIGVMLFFKIGELLQDVAVNKSRRSIRGLLAARPEKALLQGLEGYREVDPEAVGVGDMILVKPGDKIPLDGVVQTGDSQVDTSALTGEFMPLSVRPGAEVMAGQINQTGALTIRVTRPFAASSIAKIMDLVERATARKAATEKFITTFARYYTPAVVLTAAAIACLPPLLISGQRFETWLYRALVILVISCPCALVLSIPLGYFAGIGKASRSGILVKGSNFIDVLSKVRTVVFDKTGTLTQGVFQVKEIVSLNGFAPDRILEFAAAAESHSTHPIATSILEAYRLAGGTILSDDLKNHTAISGKGVSVRYKGFRLLVGNERLLRQEGIAHDNCDCNGTVAHLAVNGELVGHLIIGDRIRPDAPEAVKRLRGQGVRHIALLTGDNRPAGQTVAKRLGIDSLHANLLPEDKVRVLETLHREKPSQSTIAFVGDGLNDAPVIARADVGIAMGAIGSDAAIETADVVLVSDSPSKVAEAITISRKTRRIVRQNILLAFAIKGFFISFGALGMATMWEAVFADVGTALLAILNSARILRMR